MSLPWQVVLVIYLLVARIIVPVFNKRIASDPYKPRNLLMQYFLAAILAISVAGFFGDFKIRWELGAVVLIGVFNAFACYAYWQAIDISLSKTSLFTQGDDLITLGLGFLILGEAKFLTLGLGIGILLCFGAVMLFAYNKWRLAKEDHNNKVTNRDYKKKSLHLSVWIAIYSIIWGGAVFSMRYFALRGVPVFDYVGAWYIGAFFGAQIIYWVSEFRRDKKEKVPSYTAANFKVVARVVVCIYASIVLNVWLRNLAPIAKIQPIDQVAEMIFPMVIGLYVFKEIKQVDWLSGVAMLIGIVGGLLIAFSY